MKNNTAWQEAWQTLKEKYNHAHEISERIVKMRNDHARRVCKEAGLDPTLLGIHPHNAMCSFHSGQPWPGVNYSKVRLCQRILDTEFQSSRIVDRYYNRLWNELMVPLGCVKADV